MTDVTLPLRFLIDEHGSEWTYGHCPDCGYETTAYGSERGVRRESFEHVASRHPDVLAALIASNKAPA